MIAQSTLVLMVLAAAAADAVLLLAVLGLLLRMAIKRARPTDATLVSLRGADPRLRR